jgi:uncharacterized protein (DUF1800 family)
MRKNYHFLSRATFGPTKESMQQVESTGIESWLDQQLRPEQINNSRVERLLGSLPSLFMSATELLREYPRPEQGESPAPGKEFWRPFLEVSCATLLLARYSESQLLEIMTNFWFNHFNVFGPEGINFYATPPYIMETIRKNALGTFPKLLQKTAKSPAMLYYLDNYLSSREMVLSNGEEKGINENYARELMELHTLGVDAGYTQEDIINAAKILTGWSITRPRTGELDFQFYENIHEPGTYQVFGQTFASRGMQQGLDMIAYLALRPETAQHVAEKLVAAFVADDPPSRLIQNVKDVFLATGGDIPSLLKTIFLSREFYEVKYLRAKIKSPLRFFISSLRATGADILDAEPVLRPFQSLGQPLFRCQPPTGYSDKKEAVLGTGVFLSESLLTRTMAFDRLRGVSMSPSKLNPDNLTGIDLADALMEGILVHFEHKTAEVVRKASLSYGFGPRELISLILVTPDFLLY